MAKPFLSIIIPAYNEAKRLPLTLIDIDKHLSKQEFSYEILVVNDGSTDNTAEIVNRFMPMINDLKLLDNPDNRGKGAVVKQGMLSSKGNWRLFMDADNSTAITEFLNMMPYFSAGGGSSFGGKESYDIVIGSRAVKGAKLQPPQPIHRQILGKLGNLFIQALVLKGTWDSQCGFKCFSEQAAERIFSLAKINRFAFDIEALALARKFGYQVKEMPVTWVNDTRSQVPAMAYLQVLWETIKIRWWLRNNKYSI